MVLFVAIFSVNKGASMTAGFTKSAWTLREKLKAVAKMVAKATLITLRNMEEERDDKGIFKEIAGF